MNMPKSNPKFGVRVVGLILGIAVGIVGAFALREYQDRQTQSSDVVAALLQREQELTSRNAFLRTEVSQLQSRVQAMEVESVRADQDTVFTLQELERARLLSGQKDMHGPGVEVILNDAPRENIRAGDDINWYLVHDVDVLRVVNLLRSAGAECISINGERLLSNSRIRCGGPTIHVKDRPLTPPFVIRAIGDARSLSDALTAVSPDGGMSEMDLLRFYGIQASVSMVEELVVPRYIGEFLFRYAKAEETVQSVNR